MHVLCIVASSLASRDGTHAHCSMNIKYGVYSRAATITTDTRLYVPLLHLIHVYTCGVYSRAATIRSAVFIRGNTVFYIRNVLHKLFTITCTFPGDVYIYNNYYNYI